MPIQPDLLLPFLVASVLVTVVPGADMALVTRQVLVGGPALAQKTIFGNLAGLRAHGLLTAPRVRAWLERTTGVVLIAFGLAGGGRAALRRAPVAAQRNRSSS